MSVKNRGWGFTLVELLVVIGIIAVLISVLLPTLGKARESANSVKCQANIRQITTAFMMYTAASKGQFPGQGLLPATNYDWVLWQTYADASVAPPAGLKGSDFQVAIKSTGIGPFLNLSQSNVAVMRCPSDQGAEARQLLTTTYNYPFSYQVNWAMGTNPYVSLKPGVSGNKGPYYRAKIAQVKNSAEKVLLIEADERYVHDGQTAISQPMVPASAASFCNLLSDRHDTTFRKKFDWAPDGSHGNVITNSGGKGNAGFCDGHVEYVPRSYVHTRRHSMPDPNDYPGYTEPTMN